MLEGVCSYLEKFLFPPKDNLPVRHQILMTLLRLNLPFRYLSMQTGLSIGTVNSTFLKIIELMYLKFRFLIKWPDRESIWKSFPKFTLIIDCIEIFIERPKNLKAREQVYSSYKRHSTVKLLLSCSSLGVDCRTVAY